MADDIGLPGYLRHAATGAWFDPLTLSASLPFRVGEAVEEERVAILHEHVHYIQAISTIFGAIRFQSRWESIAGLARVKTRERVNGVQNTVDLEHFRADHLDRRLAIEDLAMPTLYDVEERLSGFHVVDTGERSLVVFAKPTAEGARLFPLGAHALQEGMAMAIERALGFSQRAYGIALRSDQPAFFYAAPAEAVRSQLGDGDDLWWTTAALCDVALDHGSPQHAFFLGLRNLVGRFGRLPPASALPEVYASLREAVRMDNVEQERELLIWELTSVAERGAGSADPFDSAFATLFRTILDAFATRRNTPDAFLQGLLDPGGSLAALDRFLLPAYVVRDQLLTLSATENLIQSVVFLILGGHYLECSVDEKKPRICPLRDLQHCTFERVLACSTDPWTRPEEDGQACAYRFVAHALEHAGAMQAEEG